MNITEIIKIKFKKITLLLFFILFLFVFLHLTPNLSIRTCLFIHGHFTSAFTSDIEINFIQNDLDKNNLADNEKIYCIKNTNAVFFDTKNPIYNFKVTKNSFLYFTNYYGEL